MTTVTSLTADRMLAIEAASVIDGDVINGNLILTKHDGTQINAGPVTGSPGPPGPVGQDQPILTAAPVLDVGQSGQIRAGRQLTAADFTAMGLSVPIGLWNLSDLSDASGNGRNLLNKGAVPFDIGINGGAATSAKFVGSTAQALYIPDTGVNDPFRIRTGSVGCWFKTAKRGTYQALMGKEQSGDGARNYGIQITSGNVITAEASSTGAQGNMIPNMGVSDVADDRWHYVVSTWDGVIGRLYIDGILEGTVPFGLIFSSPAPWNIGGLFGDSSTVTANPHFGRVDEAFVTADVLSEDQIRNLYCVKIPHTLAAVPSRVSLNVHRRRKGATLAVADFPTQPLRLYNFSGGSLGDEGSNGTALTNPGGATNVAGVDGSSGNAMNFNGVQSLPATDAGLPSGVATCSYGCWFKMVSNSSSKVIMMYGTVGTQHREIYVVGGTGLLNCVVDSDSITGPFVQDGVWHFVCMVEDNGAVDGIKRKQYLDGRLTGISTVFNPVLLAGANAFRIGVENPSGTGPFVGQVDSVFVCDYALTTEQIWKLYAKSLTSLASSPKNSGDHVEAMSASSLLATFDTLEMQHTIDLMVAP